MESYLSTLWGELNGAGEVDFFIKGLAKFPFKFLGHDIYITTAHVCALIVMVALIIFAIIANRVIKKAIVTDTPGNFQNVVELIVEMLDNMVTGTMGKNGKKFKMYKFRSMYMDAEERKAELMKDNKLGDGKMFKLDFDPRVIGNKILPDGTHKTGIGDFIRRTSLDEFPQFFNVLRGDMSIIGTRPPLISETNLYELHHRARLAIKPGITGMWQVSGRSDITDFEEVVRLDKEYITNWNIGLDIKILFKTVLVVFKKDGSM